MRRTIAYVLTFLSFLPMVSLACGQALSTDHPGFCASFKSIAECHCSKALPKAACTDMNKIYDRMTIIYGSVERACAAQHDTSPQTCIDDWNCYRHGGTDSQGRLCSGTGRAC